MVSYGCYHNVITFILAQSDHIKRLLLYLFFKFRKSVWRCGQICSGVLWTKFRIYFFCSKLLFKHLYARWVTLNSIPKFWGKMPNCHLYLGTKFYQYFCLLNLYMGHKPSFYNHSIFFQLDLYVDQFTCKHSLLRTM